MSDSSGLAKALRQSMYGLMSHTAPASKAVARTSVPGSM
eukprot:CAMPEP_0172749906 /NCGR_PEP_ID=MMETSP1074-20121228/148456_1 /TAXON_ID=2916 /ORGANISM="Ceratium fusus, Strain PA161109" /LENGTH=38 /DNA_ID= /DNA_START= /DNA_END= /DNA_ORIENTATION=